MRRSPDHPEPHGKEQDDDEPDQVDDIGSDASALQPARMHGSAEPQARDRPVQAILDQMRHVAAVRDLLQHAALGLRGDLPFRPQNELEHEP